MAILTKTEKYVAETYARYFGKTADANTIKDYVSIGKTSKILKQIIEDADIAQYNVHGNDLQAEVHNEFQNLFSRNATNKELEKYVKVLQKGKNLPINSIVKKASKFDKDVYKNKQEIAKFVAENGGKEIDLSKVTKANPIDVKSLTSLTDLQAQIDALPENSNVPSSIDGKTEILTINVDTFVGTAKNDLFLATQKSHWSVADSIDGGKGIDTLKIIDAGAIAQTDLEPISATIKNVEILDLISGATVTADTTSIDGVTDLYTTSKGTNSSTAAETTNINATASALTGAGAVNINGGKNVTVTASDTSTTAAASGNTILVGNTTAAKGTVAVTYTETVSDGAANANIAGGAITVTGGTTVTVNSNAVVGAGSAAGDVLTIGAVAVNGNASTTAVTVNQTAATAAYAVAGDKIKITNGAVTITDTNAPTAADTIATVSLNNFGLATITSSALSTLNVKGGASATTASGNLDLLKSAADTTVLPTTLNVNSTGGFIGALGVAATSTMANTYTAVNVTSTAATTFADAGLAANKTLTVSGEGVTTFTAFTAANNAALTSIVSSGAGLTIGTQLATNVAVTGGAGVENIKIGATTKTVDLGAGDDIATISVTSFGAGGSLNGGAGNDTLVVDVITSNIAGLPHISGFETLQLGASANGKHNAHTFTALEVGAITGASEFENVAAGVGLTVLASTGFATTVTLANATGTADVFNLTLKSAAIISANTVNLAGVETVNINVADAATAGSAAVIHTLTLAAADATSVVVSGNNGLNLTNANAKITTFDASGVVANGTADTAANLAVTFASANNTVGELVTIIGGAGDDTLTGTATANDTIIGGAGADTLVYTGRADTFTGGAGDDTFDINALGTKALHLTIADLTKGDKIDLSAISNNTVNATWNSTKVTLGAAATLDNYLDAAAAALTGGTDSIARWFQFDGNTYLVNDNSNNATFTEGTDAVIKITGLVNLSTATYATATDIITIA